MYYVAMQSNSSTVRLALQKEIYLSFNGILLIFKIYKQRKKKVRYKFALMTS